MAVRRFSHVGLCVRDLARARAFYVDGLGFRELSRLRVRDEETSRLLGLALVDLEAAYLERDGFRLELLHYRSPGCEAASAVRPMNLTGLTHLSLVVSDLDAALASLASLGARPLPDSRMENRAFASRAIFVLDPDGARVELVEGEFDPANLDVSGRTP
jgi:catechol 2,3-dioxygenase-like lactoylglutathione lyase family enzyme